MLVVDNADVERIGLVGECRRRDHLRAAKGEVPEFVDGYLADVARPLDDVRVAGHHTLDIGDDDHLVGVDVLAEHHRRGVATTAAECRDTSLVVLCEKARHDGHDTVCQLCRQPLGPPLRLRHVHLAVGVGDDWPVPASGFEKGRLDTPRVECPLEHPDGGALAHADNLGAVALARVELYLL